MTQWQECSGHDNVAHKIHHSLPLYNGLCQRCAIHVARMFISRREPVPHELVRAMSEAMDKALKDWQDEIREGARDAQRWAEDAADRAREDAYYEMGYRS